MTLPITAGFAVQKMDGGRKRDGFGFGPFTVGDANWGVVFHTTETTGVPGYLRTVNGVTYSVAPHFTYYAAKRIWIQHNRLDVRAGTLSGTSTLEAGNPVPTNGAKVLQVEIVCYSSKTAGATQTGSIWVGNLTAEHQTDLAVFIEWASSNFAVPLVWYPKKSAVSAVAMSHDEWWGNRTWGITDHSTAPDTSTHWDCGAIRSQEIMALIPGGGTVPAPPDEPEPGWPLLLRHGDKGPIVRVLRGLLYALGHLDSTGSLLANQFGSAVEGAVKAFQTKAGLVADGIVGPKTKTALYAAIVKTAN
jgi:hypothetical protein